MQAIVIKTGEVVEVEKTAAYCATWSDSKRIYNQSELDFNVNSKTLNGWIARDINNDLFFYKSKPHISSQGYWQGDNPTEATYIENNIFPELRFDSGPLEVTIIIKPKEK